MRVYCETFGCTANRGDTELMLGCLQAAGHEVVEEVEQAELLIVNTCAVKGPTQHKVLRRLKELRGLDGKLVLVAGCLPLIDLPSIERLGTFAGIISCHSINSIVEVVERISRGEGEVRALGKKPFEKPCLPKLRLSRVSAIVSISEGCLANCSYCSVKLARGRLFSFGLGSIRSEVEEALRAGYREVLLTSQDTAAYGLDSGSSLPELLGSITSLPGRFKIRVGMMNPASVKRVLPGLLEVYESEHVYKFLHLPVQSGDNGVLAAMRRGYTVEDFLEIVGAFRSRFRDLYLATDVIVGFPGEGEEQFERTRELIERVKPDKVNLSRFFPMPGTEAAKLKPVEGREVKRRSRELSSLCRRVGLERNRAWVGRVEEGLVVEKGQKGGVVARLANYKPVILPRGRLGEFVQIRITEARPTYLLGEVVE